MKNHWKGSLVFLSALVFVCALFTIKYLGTGGFRAEKIHSHCLTSASFDFSSSGFSEKMLDQPFYYLGKGRQAYVFSSQDGKYVIKFLRDQKYRPSLWMRASIFFHALSSSQKKVLREQSERLERALLSYQLASLKLSSETEILRTHIGQGPLSKNILLVDGFSRKFAIDLGTTSFLLQRKGENLGRFLLRCHQKNDVKLLQSAICGFFETIKRRVGENILVRDAHCTLQNTALCRGRVIEIDVGSFYEDAQCDRAYEIKRSAGPLREFIEKNIPEVLSFFDEEWKRAL